MPDSRLERRAAFAAVVGTVGLFCGLLLLLPVRPPGFDEAKYLGIGLNVLGGHGARTAFGVFFEPHSPLWPVVMAAPQAWLGIDAYAWAHVLNIVAAGAVVSLGATLGWGIRPAAGALTAIGILGSAYLFGIARRTGLDMPAAALSLGYLVAGLAAVRRGSAGLGIVAGALFAAGFLVKEIVVPLAPVPLLAGVAWRRPSTGLVRVATAMLATAAIATSWWWILFAAETGRVYRLGTPAWTLVPIALAVLAVVVLGLAWERPGVAHARVRLRARVAAGQPGESAARAAAWSLAVAWAVALAAFFARTWELRGGPLVDAGQLAFYAGRWFEELVPFVALGGIGTALELGRRRHAATAERRPVIHLLLALACSVPLVLLVVGVGEHPRHYIAQLVILTAVGAAGWLSLLEDAAARPTRRTVATLAVAAGLAVVLVATAFLGRLGTMGVVAALGAASAVGLALVVVGRLAGSRLERSIARGGVAAAVVGAAFVTASIGTVALQLGRPVAAIDGARAEAVAQVTAWLRQEVPAGSTVAFNGTIGHEAAVEVQDRLRPVMVREDESVVFDPAAPLGMRSLGGPATDDWITLMTSPNIGSTFVGYRASELIDTLRGEAVDVWVVAGLTGPDAPLVVDAALTPEHGFRRLTAIKVPYSEDAVEAVVLGIDRDRLGFGRELFVSADAMARLLDHLDGDPAAPAIADALLARVVIVPAGPRSDNLRGRLALAAGR